ncbi:MAG: hypothetical protein LBW85_01855 [Deltaproteobacteria bacterium]|jgi:hypothetical protein|nr:hypothetical protein [Deltaproteobacteria bacterium]
MEAIKAGPPGMELYILEDVILPDSLTFFDRPLPYDSAFLREKVSRLLPEARALAKPWAAFAVCAPELSGGDLIRIGGRDFSSGLLVRELGSLPVVFPFLASEGWELARWSEGVGEDLRKAAFAVRYIALHEAHDALERHIGERWEFPGVSAVTPGTLEEWPLSEQRPLFDLMGPAAAVKGMALNGRLMLEPTVSGSGIYFHSPSGFHNCYLCRDDECQLRVHFRRE